MRLDGIKITENLYKYSKRLVETRPYSPKGELRYVSESQFLSPGLTKSMSKEDAKDFIYNNSIKTFSMFNQKVKMKINGQNVVGEWLEGGGSKCAYRVKLNGEEVCVLLPHNNWSEVMNEPQNTLALKKLGLVTNDYCKIIPVEADGQMIPALISKPYDRHSFKIFDKKNPNDDLSKYFDLTKVTEDNIEAIFSPLVKDVKTLIDNRVRILPDSFNLALKDGQLRLYLNDLPYNRLFAGADISDKKIPYLNQSLSAFVSAINDFKIKDYPFVYSLSTSRGKNDLLPKLEEIYRKIS